MIRAAKGGHAQTCIVLLDSGADLHAVSRLGNEVGTVMFTLGNEAGTVMFTLGNEAGTVMFTLGNEAGTVIFCHVPVC